MPPTVNVAAFVFGIVLLLAALIGKELKVVTVELPALGPGSRIVLGLLGICLTAFGLLEGKMPDFNPTAPSAVSSGTQQASAAMVALAAPGQATPATAAQDDALPCLADVAETDLVLLPMDPARRTDRKWSTGQPRAGVLAMQFEDASGVRGGVKFKTLASAGGIDIVAVFDAACQPVSTYSNVSRPDQPRDEPYNFDTMRYTFGDAVYTADISYGEGDGKMSVRAQEIGP
ncbi:MAG TPA: hypothetical protein VL334_04430 [Anaerolineae bacterium]|nr:hypothetical protein [Anaerolineae bacterium]